MKNELLEEIWRVRREIEGEGLKGVDSLVRKLKRRQARAPSKYYTARRARPVKGRASR